ncbi:hypothetical protein JX265_002790 [Neoarthrinium moseri]|uniref:SnoaL-like domain-containing protein n=1 Tax=Neoarthrinium moseri TaxID=1658444 RepID=A0A9P9WSI8_9PEZI|nr:hypothetical protein JX265_002790 [Neoarthrinium moseri]
MRSFSLVTLLTLPLAALATPTRLDTPARTVALEARQAVVTPPPCVPRTPEPSRAESKCIFDRFVDAFLVRKNLTEAFSYVDEGYINHSAAATANGSAAALDVLGPIWPTVQVQLLSEGYTGPNGTATYNISGLGPDTLTITDTWRMQGGCIVEHWDTTS